MRSEKATAQKVKKVCLNPRLNYTITRPTRDRLLWKTGAVTYCLAAFAARPRLLLVLTPDP